MELTKEGKAISDKDVKAGDILILLAYRFNVGATELRFEGSGGGFGSRAGGDGKLYGKFVHDSEECHIRRYDVNWDATAEFRRNPRGWMVKARKDDEYVLLNASREWDKDLTFNRTVRGEPDDEEVLNMAEAFVGEAQATWREQNPVKLYVQAGMNYVFVMPGESISKAWTKCHGGRLPKGAAVYVVDIDAYACDFGVATPREGFKSVEFKP
jgi:hypothetical protein